MINIVLVSYYSYHSLSKRYIYTIYINYLLSYLPKVAFLSPGSHRAVQSSMVDCPANTWSDMERRVLRYPIDYDNGDDSYDYDDDDVMIMIDVENHYEHYLA